VYSLIFLNTNAKLYSLETLSKCQQLIKIKNPTHKTIKVPNEIYFKVVRESLEI